MILGIALFPVFGVSGILFPLVARAAAKGPIKAVTESSRAIPPRPPAAQPQARGAHPVRRARTII